MKSLEEAFGLEPTGGNTVAADLSSYLRERANFHGVDPNLAASIFQQESSSGRNSGVSTAGARGPMQLMPATFKQMYPEGNIDDPRHNIEAGIRYLKHGKATLGTDDPRLLAAGYYQGYNRDSLKRGEIQDTNPDPNAPSVPQYADQVAGRLPRFRSLEEAIGLEGSPVFPMYRGEAAKTAPKTAAARNAFAYANDFMINAANAFAGLVKAGSDLASPGGSVSSAIDQFIKSGRENQSDWQKQSDARLADELKDAGSEWDKPLIYLRHALVDDPLKLVAEGAGNIGPFALLGKSLQAARVAEPVAEKIVMATAAMLGAGEVRGNIYERIQQIPDADLRANSADYATLRQTMSEKDAKHALGSRFVEHLPELAITAIVSALGGKYGLEGLAAKVGPKGVGRLGAGGIGALDEGAQGAVEQVASNVGVRRSMPGQSLTEDVALNAAMEGVLGGVGGLAAGSPEKAGAKPGQTPPLAPAGTSGPPAAPGGIPTSAEEALGNSPAQPLVSSVSAVSPDASGKTVTDPLGRVPLPEGLPAVVRSNRALPVGETPEGMVAMSDVPEMPPPPQPPQWEDDGARYTILPIDEALFQKYMKPGSLSGMKTWDEYHARYPLITHMRLRTKDGGRTWTPTGAPFVSDEQTLMRTVPAEALQAPVADVATVAVAQPTEPEAPASEVTPPETPLSAPPTTPLNAPLEAVDTVAQPQSNGESPLDNRSPPLDNGESPNATVEPPPAVDVAAHEAATSPENNLPPPTQAQQEAGNYKKGHAKIHGLDVSIENPAGSIRSGTDEDGKAWETTMANHYGYIRRTEGADGDHVDVFIGPNPEATTVFVVDQVNPKTGEFDEHKVMLGFDSMEDAKAAYRASYAKGWKGLKAISAMPIDEFKDWLKNGDTTKPLVPEKTLESAKPVADLDSMFDDVLAEELAKNEGTKAAEKPAPASKAPAAPRAKKEKKPAAKWRATGVNKNGDVIEVSDTGLHSYVKNGIRTVMLPLRPGVWHEDVVRVGPVPDRTAGEAAASAAKNTAAGLNAAIDGLGALFGGNGKLSSGLSFDEETYAKAKPLFQQAVANLKAAGTDIQDVMRAVIRMVLDKFGADTVKAMKPYVVRFVEDVRGGKIQSQQEEGNGPTVDSGTEPGSAEVPSLGGDGSAADNGRGGQGQSGASAGNDEVLGGASSQHGNSSGPGGNAESGSGTGAEDARSGGGEPGGGNVSDGRPGAGGTGLAPDGAGGKSDVTPPPPKQPTLGNYHIKDPESLVGGSPKVRFERNKAAIETFRRVLEEARDPTEEERDTIARYIGWGSFGQELFQGNWDTPRPKPGWEEADKWLRGHLGKSEWESAQRSIINAHYTDPPTVTAMWDMVRKMGFKGGRVLEPSVGIGNFFGLMPRDLEAASQLTGIELDELTGGMAKVLYPDANIQIKGYQESHTSDNFYDLVIGNWPFAAQGPSDRRYRLISPTLHDYFFLKALDQVKPGGIVIGITSSGTMDKVGKLTRLSLARNADLVASFRLPSGAFEKYAGTAVVTDIVILKKRLEPNAAPEKSGWIEAIDMPTPVGPTIRVNEYYRDHPDHVLGTLNYGHGTTQGRAGMIVDRPSDLMRRITDLKSQVPADIYDPRTGAKPINYVANDSKERENAVTEGAKGGLFVVRGEFMAPLHEIADYRLKDAKKTRQREDAIRALIKMRRAYDALVAAERDGSDDAESKRAELNRQYADYTKVYGVINRSDALSLLRKVGDPHWPALAALEHKSGNEYVPSQILTKSTVRTKKKLDKPSVRDAYVIARNESIQLNMDRIAEQSGTTSEQAAKELLDAGAIFRTPAGLYESRDVYLSGNVRRKMREAVDAKADGQDMDRNIAALQEVMPEDTPYYKIEAKLGAPWVSVPYYKQYVADLLKLTDRQRDGLEIVFRLGQWKVDIPDDAERKAEARNVWGTERVNFGKILAAAFNNTKVTVRDRDSDGNLVVNEAETRLANEKVGRLREEFSDWVWRDFERRGALEREFNEVMNAEADPQFDGSFLTLEGMALQRGDSPFSLRKHQVNAIWRGLANRRGLNAHEVGTGKTYTMGGLAIESRRYGIARKPLILAHNANAKSVTREIQEMYPGAKLLYLGGLDKDQLPVAMRQIANDEWDAVIVPHSRISMFSLKRETLMRIAAQEILAMEQAAIEAAQEKNIKLTVDMMNNFDNPKVSGSVRDATAKELVKARNSIIARIDDMAQRATKEGAIPFEDIGLDMIIVDEAHEFGKPPLATAMKLRGLNKSTSNRSLSLQFLTSYVRSLNGGTGVHLFTGTPITNTLNEIFNMQRYVAEDVMSRDGVSDWDSWFNTFADSATDVELNAAGQYEPVTRLASFVNVAELRRMIGSYTDIVFADDMPEFAPRPTSTGKIMSDPSLTQEEISELVNGRVERPVGRPYKKIVNDVGPMSPEQSMMLHHFQGLATQFKNARGKERMEMMRSGHPASPVILETNAANAAMDARLYNKDASDFPDSKANRCVTNVVRHYQEHPLATQVIFLERGFSDESVRTKKLPGGKVLKTKVEKFNLVRDIVEKLMERGIKRSEIAVVAGGVTDEKKKEIADAMNRSEIRVVIGQTGTLGVGVNMQVNLRAMHHLDAPWRPGDLEQRNGRGHRQGNKWNTVLEYRYITDRLDGRRWQVLAVKDRFIKAFLKADKSVRVIEGDAASMDEDDDILGSLSEAAGDPRILLLNKYKQDVERLETRKRTHEMGQRDAKWRLDQVRKQISSETDYLGRLELDAAAVESLKDRDFEATVDGKPFTDRKEFDAAFQEYVGKADIDTKGRKVGTLYGIPIRAKSAWKGFHIELELENAYEVGPSAGSMESKLRGIKNQVPKTQQRIAELEESTKSLEGAIAAPFPRESDLKKKRDLYERVEADLDANPVPPPPWLRQGAPVNTEIRIAGKAYVVNGHQYAKDGYFVLVESAQGVRRVPYIYATDDQGQPLYEPRKFEAPPDRGPRPLKPGDFVVRKSDKTHWKVLTQPREVKADGATRVLITVENLEDEARHEVNAHEFERDESTLRKAVVPDLELTAAELRRAKQAAGIAEEEPKPADFEYLERMATSFSRRRHPAARTRVKDIEAAIAPVRRVGRGLPPVVTVQSVEQLPTDLQQYIRKDGSVPRGAFHNGSIYLIGNNLTSPAEGVFTLLHEAAHYGLEGVFGRELTPVLMKIYQDNESVRGEVAKLRADHPQLSIVKAVEEVLADTAGRGERPTFMQRFVAWIRDWFRRRGIQLKMTDGDVLAIIGRAQRYWQRPTKWTHLYSTSFSTPAPIFYSQLATVVGQKGSTATATEWKQRLAAWINGGQVKRDEVEWSGVREWLDLQPGRVKVDQVLDYLRENGVRVEEVRLGAEIPMSALPHGWTVEQEADNDDGSPNFIVVDEEGELMGEGATAQEAMRDAADPDMMADLGVETGLAKYGEHTLPGGENYRELLLTLPDARNGNDKADSVAQGRYRGVNPEFRSGHFDHPNILAHVRFNERTDAEGRRVLFIEEIQSDWAQAARKKGFTGDLIPQDTNWVDADTVEWKDTEELANAAMRELLPSLERNRGVGQENRLVVVRDGEGWGVVEQVRMIDPTMPRADGVPRAPFVTKTESWVALALKRVIRMAAEEGYDAVAWTTGEQNTDRYDLSKHISRMEITKYTGASDIVAWDMNGKQVMDETGVSDRRLPDVIGKELAERAMKQEHEKTERYAGLDLKVGGEGMRSFYDKIVPSVAVDVLKKVGGGRVAEVRLSSKDDRFGLERDFDPATVRVQESMGAFTVMDASGSIRTFDSRAEAERYVATSATLTQPGFLITPDMREKAMQGLPMFSRAPAGWDSVEADTDRAQNGSVPSEVIADEQADRVFANVSGQLARKGLGTLPAGALRRVSPHVDRLLDSDPGRAADIRGAERVAETFGHSVVWFENASPEIVDFGGFVSQLDQGRIYVNVNNRRPHLLVVGHELFHRMRKERPDLYDTFLKAVRPLMRDQAAHEHPFAGTEDARAEELLADFAGWNMMRRGFWRSMAMQDRTAFGKIADYVLSFLDRIVTRLRGRVPDMARYFTDVITAQRELTDVMAQWRAGQIVPETEALQFSMDPGGGDAQFAPNDAPPREGRFVSEYRERAKTFFDRVKMEFDPFAFLPARKELEAMRYRLLGRIASFDEIAKDIKSIFTGASDEDQQAAYRYFLDPNGDPSSIPTPSVAAMAERAKRLIESVGDALVARGVLSEEAREAHRGRYLPQVYLKFLLGDENWKALGGGKKISNQGYLKGRSFERRIGADGEVHLYEAATGKMVDEEFVDAVMGPVRDPGYLSSLAIVRPMRDMAILDYLAAIAGNQDWVLAGSVIDWRGKKVSAHWAKIEAQRLRKQSRHQDGQEAQNAVMIADELDSLADEALGEIAGEHADYRQIPDTARYGRLRGIWVRREIYDDLMGVNDFIPADPGWAMSLLGYGGIGSKVTALWKAGKVSLNPPAQVRNFVSNMVLLQLSGIPLHRMPGLFFRSMRQILNYNEWRKGAGQLTPEQRDQVKHYLVALKYGVTESTFQAQEVYRMQRDLLDLERRAGRMRLGSRVKLMLGAVLDFASDKYQLIEALGKTMKIMDEIERNGAEPAAAALAAQEALFDYSLVSKNVRYLRNAPMGMPFVTFAVKVAPVLMKTALRHPQRFIPWVALAYGLPALVASMLGVDDDDLEKLKKALPEWLRDRGHAYILPVKDAQGRWQAVDLGYFFPWTTWTEPIRTLASGEAGKTVQALGMFSGPITDLIVAVTTGRDSFTGREIVQAGDPPQRQYVQMVMYLWNMAMPPIITEFGTLGKSVRAYAGETNRFGDPLATGWQAAWSAMGVNLHAIHPETSRMQEARRMMREIRDVEWRLKQKMSDRALTDDAKASLMAEYREEIGRRQDKLIEYLQESEIVPALRTGPTEEVTQ